MANIIWFNGEYVDGTKPFIDINDRGWEYGAGVFDSMLIIDGKPINPENHINRLFRHCKTLLNLEPWISKQEWLRIVQNIIDKNNLDEGRYVLKTQVTEGIGERGLFTPKNIKATIIIRCIPAPVQEVFKPAEVIIAKTRRNEGSIHSQVKSLSYMENILARKEAEAAKVDDVIMLNNKGHVTCSTTGNIFIIKEGKLYTGPQSDGINDGTIREKILTDQSYYPAQEKSLNVDDLFNADGVFITNTVMGLRPIASIDAKALAMSELDFPKDFHLY